MATPNIVKGQIAIDPTNDLLYYINESNTLVSTSLSWAKNNTAIQTAENVVIGGDLTVSGTTVTLNAETLLIEDNIIVLNTGVTGSPSLNAGIEVERGTSTNVQIRWNEATDKWQFSNDGATFYNIVGEGSDISANVTGNLIGNVNGNVSGNLTGNVTGNVNGNLTGNVFGNVTGNLSGNVTGNVTGNADTASKLASAKKIELTGPVTGYALFDGSANVTISTSLTSETTSINSLSDVTLGLLSSGDFLKYNGSAWVNDPIDLGTDTNGNYVANLNAGTGIDITDSSGEAVSPTISVNTSVIQTRVTNISDTEISYLDGVTSLIQNQLDSKAPTSSPTFTGNVSGITKSMVGLVNVDNTSDLDKPISNATQESLDLKSNIASPTFTGNVNISTLFVDSIQIDPAGATPTQVLRFDGTKFSPGIASTVAALDDLTDVNLDIDHLTDQQVLTWDSGTNTWVNANSTGGSGGSAGLTYFETIGNGIDSVLSVNHALGSDDISVTVRSALIPYEVINVTWEATDVNTVTFRFSTPPDNESIRVCVFASTSGSGFTPTAFRSLTDVQVNSRANNDILKYNSSSGKWENDSSLLAAKAPLFSPALTGMPTSITPDSLSNNTQVATTAFVQTAKSQAISDAANSAIAKTTLTAKGDILTSTANSTPAVLSLGVDGYFLKANSSAATGIEWSSIPIINNLDDISDVNVSSKSTNDLLKWDGSSWVAITPTKSIVGLSNVDNTTDLNKPISNATQTALDLKANANASPTITLSGDLSGNVTLSNLANATLTATIMANSVALGTDTTGDYVSSLVSGNGILISNNSGEGSTPTVTANTSYLATKDYVDSSVSGVNWHTAVKAATVGNLSGNYDNGTNGVGATLTKATSGSIGTIDGATVVANDRILLKAQTDAKQNGIYKIVTTGNATVAWQLMRASDFDGSSVSATIIPGDSVFVTAGSTNANQGFIQTTYGTGANNSIVINTDDIVFTQFTGTASLTAGDGLIITGNQLDVVTASSSRIIVNADSIDLATTGVSASTYNSVTVDTYGRVTAGTNPTTLSGYGITDAINSSLTSGYIVLGNSGGVATGTAVSGDVTIASNGNVQITANTIVNADINSAAAISYSKINLSNAIVNADINSSAAIDLSKLASGTSAQIVLANSLGVPTYTTVSGDITITNTGNVQITANTIVNADINSAAAISYSKLSLSNSIVNADINSSAAIAYSKLNLANSITTTDLQVGPAQGGFNSVMRTVTSSNTLISSDLAKLVRVNSASTVNITISNILSDGDRIDILREGAGEVTVLGSGVSVRCTPGANLRAQWSSATLIKLDSSNWLLVGDLKG